MSSKEWQIAQNLRRLYRNKSHEALHQRELLHQEEVVPQEWETDCLRVDAMKLAAYTSTKLHDEFRAMEYDASEKYEFHRNKQQEFAV